MNIKISLKALGWATYLGCSWTWCIGMFLPVILLRDFGVWSWVYFAAPNVIGAAAMGFVLSESRASEGFIERHRPACLAFSVVTMLFQLYFLAWAFVVMKPPVALLGGLLFLVLLLYWLVSSPGTKELVGAGLVYMLSLVALVIFVRDLPFTTASLSHTGFGALAPQLGHLIPVFVFGFLFSPYLDLTFHHASQQTGPGGTKLVFATGFGIVFLSMIVFTLLYAPALTSVFFPSAELHEASFSLINRPGLVRLLFAHILLQAGFTTLLHWFRFANQVKEMRLPKLSGAKVWFGLPLLVGIAVLIYLLGINRSLFGLTGHELLYRVFMAFYGLCAPAYLWICVLPSKGKGLNPKVDWITYGTALCLALPFYAWAFLGQVHPVVNIGLGLVLLAPLGRAFYYRVRQKRF